MRFQDVADTATGLIFTSVSVVMIVGATIAVTVGCEPLPTRSWRQRATTSPGAAGEDRYIRQVAPLAQMMSRAYNGAPASVAIAQSIVESDWGRSGLAVSDRNYLGMKCAWGEHGPIAIGCHSHATSEYAPFRETSAPFRVYASRLDSFRDYGRLMNTGAYRSALMDKSFPDRFIQDVAGRYCTDPEYADHIITTMREYDLYRFDHVRSPKPAEQPRRKR